uniref:Uncharacterized protein n=1 Tax=Wuchereria bancrofti TaxID=6293 RepID=A0A1I8EIE0_WUCBA
MQEVAKQQVFSYVLKVPLVKSGSKLFISQLQLPIRNNNSSKCTVGCGRGGPSPQPTYASTWATGPQQTGVPQQFVSGPSASLSAASKQVTN